MKALDVAVESIATGIADPAERQRYIGLLEDMASDCKSATDLWQQVLTQSTAPLKDSALLMNWTGPGIAKKLFNIHLDFRTKMLAITQHRGNLEDPIIPSAYHLLKPGETGTDYAQTAIEKSRQAMQAVQAHIETIRTTVPKKMSAAAVKTGANKTTVKTAAVKKAAKKPAIKSVAKKKSAAKKPAMKKAAAKSAVKKKVVVKKKAVPKKQAVAKKSASKQTVKKKAKKK